MFVSRVFRRAVQQRAVASVSRLYSSASLRSSLRSFEVVPKNPVQLTHAVRVFSRSFSTDPVEKGSHETHTFQTETKQLLNIVAHSLYTDKEVFLRELVSNASDALEKLRYLQTVGHVSNISDAEVPLEIRVNLDKEAKTITIEDTGIGMSKEDLMNHLGTIARSGSKAFLQNMQQDTSATANAAVNIIGQFGVGFYSSFIVGEKVEVFSRSHDSSQPAYKWTSDGTGTYDLVAVEGITRGTKIVIHLRESCAEFLEQSRVEKIIEKYSNFVGFPIVLSGKRLNTVQAIWTKEKDSVTEEEHQAFFKFLSGGFSEEAPLYKLHFTADAPLSIKSVMYIPPSHTEKFGLGQMEIGMNLYSRKVLIKGKCESLVPGWLRFVKGVVDSEDIPLNISRENMQDSALVGKLRTVITRRLIRYLNEQSKSEPEKYAQFFAEFGKFIKEGICTDFQFKDDLGKLVRFDSSFDKTKMVSLDEYISRMPPEQKHIYYLSAPTRALAATSPYIEPFLKKNREVLYLFTPVDEMVLTSLHKYGGKEFVSIESPSDKLGESMDLTVEGAAKLEPAQVEELSVFLKSVLGGRVSEVVASSRLADSPAIVTDHMSGSLRNFLRFIDKKDEAPPLPPARFEINPSHEIILNLHAIKDSEPQVAALVAEQLFDNSLVAAGLLDDPRSMLTRLNSLMAAVVKSRAPKSS